MDLVLLLALCVAVVVLFHRLRIPPIAGFLAAGALLGPNALGLIQHVSLVEQLAEIGVVVLLFTVGMELSLRDLLKMRRSLVLGGGLLTALGGSQVESVVLALAMAVTTAVVIQRYGLLAILVMGFWVVFLGGVPFTVDLSVFYAPAPLLALTVFVAASVGGFMLATRGQFAGDPSSD